MSKQTLLAPTGQIKLFFGRGAFRRVDLISTAQGYQLYLHTKNDEVLSVARRERDRPRTWQSVDRALKYIEAHFGSLNLVHLHLKERP
ncbi:MAG: hypothetical protein LBS70_05355 [Candidatus Accumulibacter sp.]|jgi:hypothetical protein|nr:hypothetical protein [Accumulibacter sp.]